MVTALAVTGMGWRGQVAGAQDIATTQPTREDLQAEIAQLKAESDANAQQNTKLQAQLAQVQSQQAINNADTTAAIQQVLADADKHSQFLSVDSSSTGGWDDAKKGFFLGSEDGNFYLHPGIQYQTRYVVAYDSNPHRTQEGFEQRRVKFVFDGNIFSKDLTYKFQ
jgi:hypothetical protein